MADEQKHGSILQRSRIQCYFDFASDVVQPHGVSETIYVEGLLNVSEWANAD